MRASCNVILFIVTELSDVIASLADLLASLTIVYFLIRRRYLTLLHFCISIGSKVAILGWP